MDNLLVSARANFSEQTLFFIALAGALSLFFLFLREIVRKLGTANGRHRLDYVGRFLSTLSPPFLIALAIYISHQFFALPPHLAPWPKRLALFFFLWQLIRWSNVAMRLWLEIDTQRSNNDGARLQTMRAITYLGRLALYVIIVLWGLDNFGVNITTLIAGLGVGGIAIALAVQNILSDLFASLTIVLDKPFVYGDTIEVDTFRGKIEKVGLKTTRVRSATGEQVVFPNSNLLQSRIRNYQGENEKRTVLAIKLKEGSPALEVEKLCAQLREILSATAGVRLDNVTLSGFGSGSADIDVVYWLRGPVSERGAILHGLHLRLLEAVQRSGLEFASPALVRV